MPKLRTIEILGDLYFLRNTFDIIDYQGNVCGFDVYNKDKEFLFHYDTQNKGRYHFRNQMENLSLP